MYSTDPIADMLSRIRNALMVDKPQVVVPFSQIKQQISQVLLDNKFICKVEAKGQGKDKQLLVTIRKTGSAAKLQALQRVSKPGLRVYTPAQTIPKVKNGRGLVILSTSQGIMSGDKASKARLGGEVLCSVY